MKILVLSFYYQPDLCAGSFRTTALVNELRQVVPPGSHIDVVTTLPNRYSTFSADAPEVAIEQDVSLRRIALPPHKSGMGDQAKAFMVFARQARRHCASREYDLVFATSSRLMTAVLGAWVARRQRAILYLDIRDIFVDTIKDVLPGRLARVFSPLFSFCERWAISRADRVNLVSEGFKGYFSSRYPTGRFSYFTNGIDDEFIAAARSSDNAASRGGRPLTVLYAGNIGEGQGLHAILPDLAKRMGDGFIFRVIGDGGRKEALVGAVKAAGVANVELLPPMKRNELIAAYQEADILFLHLNDYDAFKKVLPSKIFEYAAMGKPIWAGVAGYAADFLDKEVANSAVFHPCDAESAAKAFTALELGAAPRQEFLEKYARGNISRRMAEEIVATARVGP